MNSTNTHTSLSHTVYDGEIWGICKGNGMQVCAPGMGACYVRLNVALYSEHWPHWSTLNLGNEE